MNLPDATPTCNAVARPEARQGTVKERLTHSGLDSLSWWESASFDFASLRSGRTGVIVRSFLKSLPAFVWVRQEGKGRHSTPSTRPAPAGSKPRGRLRGCPPRHSRRRPTPVIPAKAGIHPVSSPSLYKSLRLELPFSVHSIFHVRFHFLTALFSLDRNAGRQWVCSQGWKHGEFAHERMDSRFRGNDEVGFCRNEGVASAGMTGRHPPERTGQASAGMAERASVREDGAGVRWNDGAGVRWEDGMAPAGMAERASSVERPKSLVRFGGMAFAFLWRQRGDVSRL